MRFKTAVCIITYKREKDLLLCINSIIKQKCKFKFDVIIVDNDNKSKLKKNIDELNDLNEININYYIESKKGIPNARNKCIEIVQDKYKYLVFIDDDEMPYKENWLELMIESIEKFKCDVVSGPVLSNYKSKKNSFLNKKVFFNRRKRHKTGTKLKNCATNNMIANVKIFKNYQRPFNENFSKIGGSDSHFFRNAHKDGIISKWNNEAPVIENIPENRTGLYWILKRMLRVGVSMAYSHYLDKRYYKIFKKFIHAIISICINVIILPFIAIIELLRMNGVFIKQLNRICKSLGYILGVFNIHISDYS